MAGFDPTLEGKYEPRTFEEHFGSWASVPRAFLRFAKGKKEWADVVALLSLQNKRRVRRGHKTSCLVRSHNTRHTPLKGRAVYGDPLYFREFRHEPVNEQGVVLLFGILAKQMGYIIESVQTSFPDCEAKREVAPGRWQRVQIEFEFESRNFRDHGHPLTGCDIIVCWRHNWPECPKHIEVVELSSIITSLR